MFDFVKLRTTEPAIIEMFFNNPDYNDCKPLNNYYHSKVHKSNSKIFLHFRKSLSDKQVIGYNTLDITISPHYNKNENLHNGNVFTPLECIKSIKEILICLMINELDYKLYKIVNIEFGINIIPNTDVIKILKGLLYSKRSEFIVKQKHLQANKISDTTKYKEIKVYAKGLQFIDNPEYKINHNTLRIEVRIKQSKGIKRLGFITVEDLLNVEKYKILCEELLKEWDFILLVNTNINVSNSKNDKFLKESKIADFWENLLLINNRNTFRNNVKRYYKLLPIKDNLHTEIKGLLIDDLLSFFDVHIPHRNCA